MTTRTVAAILPLALVLSALSAPTATGRLPQDLGAAGTWQALLKLQTTASAMHTTAHPDDEHGGVLAWLSRGLGARVALTTLTRGESGDNAIGPELFDAVGLIRTEELRRAGEYYGLDRQYFTTAIDYGFSKRLDEALEKWGREAVLRDLVAIIRTDRPFVVISRFQGNARDGHGNHQAAGLLTQDAFKAAGDPNIFPDQIAQGLRPWQALKLYMGGVREDEDWTLRVDAGQYSPWLGDSYSNFARIGLAFQRSQNSGRVSRGPGPAYTYYKRLSTGVVAPARETSFFDGIDASVDGMFRAIGRSEPAGAAPLLAAISREVANAVKGFSESDPGACGPALARGLKATRDAIERLASDPDVVFILKVKEQQFQDAINAALGVALSAVAQSAFAASPEFGPVVPGQTFDVRTALSMRGVPAPSRIAWSLVSPPAWQVVPGPAGPGLETSAYRFSVTVPADAPPSRPFFTRAGISQTRYTVADAAQLYRPAAAPALVASARYSVEGVSVDAREPVSRLEPNLPYGDEIRELMVLPALAVNVTPQRAVVSLATSHTPLAVRVEVVNNQAGPVTGDVKLEMPANWTATPRSAAISFKRTG